MKKIIIDIDDTVADTSNNLMDYAINFDKEYVKWEGIVDESMNLPRCFNWSSEETKLFLDKIFDKYVDKIIVYEEEKVDVILKYETELIK